ncbi:hypothetical protein D0T84_19600 [Dysgonomonas sp. 521]|uniref:hypothetical protein n=1 Tax=Dysgonomonas sp. 521 TaxID=2302932 RepID=UPI0013D44611|nr:hypothetical protein [Dysgonomonas sp. 521]NDV97091.1 hypothetical protein [Dysgonomonas sp. 521]
MKDYRNKKDNEKRTRSDNERSQERSVCKSDKTTNELDNQNIRLALAIEELCSDDFSFESIENED